jgi:hypothetical protein
VSSAAEVAKCLDRWASAESRGDVTELRALLDRDFVAIDSDGVVHDKFAWLQRYQRGALVHQLFRCTTIAILRGRRCALAIGHLERASSLEGRDASSACTATVLMEEGGGRIHLHGVYLSNQRELRSGFPLNDFPTSGARAVTLASTYTTEGNFNNSLATPADADGGRKPQASQERFPSV